jgi:hypothetical protein
MRQILIEVLGVLVLVVPVVAIKWNLAGQNRGSSSLLAPESTRMRWRLEIYSTDDDVQSTLVDPADVPFPVKRVRSAKAEQAALAPDTAWTLPRVELDVEVGDPLADESLAGLFGADHRVRFVTGNEAVLDTASKRLRVRAFRFT